MNIEGNEFELEAWRDTAVVEGERRSEYVKKYIVFLSGHSQNIVLNFYKKKGTSPSPGAIQCSVGILCNILFIKPW